MVGLFVHEIICSATAIVNEDGSVVKLNRKSLYQREAVAKELLTTSSHSGIPKQVVILMLQLVFCVL